MKSVKKTWVDGGYRGESFHNAGNKRGNEIEVILPPAKPKRNYDEHWRVQWEKIAARFTVLPRRWVVERTFAWIGRYRRMSKDYEYHCKTSEALIYACHARNCIRKTTLIT